MNLKKHTSHKECNIDWLDYIPTHWDVKKFKHYYSSSMGNTILKEELSDAADIPVYSATERVEVLGYINNPNVLLHRDDFIIPARGNSIGHVKLVEDDCTCTQTTIYAKRLLANRINPHFVYWYQIGLRKKLYEFDNTAIPQLTVRQVKENPILCPSISEQQIIAFFLDRETARIDALIRKKERMIELLKEKRIALITQAVTKGLNPNVPMKDSGIEWLGEVPEHWEVKKLRYITTRIQTGCTPPTSVEEYYDSGTVDWFGPSSFKEALYLTEPVKLINQKAIDDGSARLFSKGTIMLIGIGATIGKIAQITQDASCNQQITAITMKARIVNSDYATYQLKLFEDIIRGIAPSATLAIFDQNKISDLSMAIPPIKEQNEIVGQLMLDIGRADKLEIEVLSSISLLREYRSSLINAAVTGKIDLREAL
jgi:type I restriction enzyme S subunit